MEWCIGMPGERRTFRSAAPHWFVSKAADGKHENKVGCLTLSAIIILVSFLARGGLDVRMALHAITDGEYGGARRTVN
jgi:hypothetical protein